MVARSIFDDLTLGSLFSMTPSRTFKKYASPSLKRNRVVFSERVKVLEIPSAKGLTKKDKKSLWYSDPVESVGRRSIMRQLLCVPVEIRDDENECEDDRGSTIPEERRKMPVTAVLDEQRYQRESGIEDSDFIARIYKQCSAHSVMKAQIKAMQHEQEVRENTSLRVKRKSKQILRRILVR